MQDNSKWEIFFREKIEKILNEKKQIIDIGGGLRVDQSRNNRAVPPSRQWILRYLDKVDYKVMDPIPDYNPDIIGDIHQLPFEDNSVESFICIAVLEHIENPIKGVVEMLRCLQPGGYCFVAVPFLFYYHAERGYYKDYWRFSRDVLEYLFKDFKVVEIEPIRGRFETWLHLSPLGKYGIIRGVARWLDKVANKPDSKQVSGYNIFAIK